MVLFAPIRGSTLETFSVRNNQTNFAGRNGLVKHDSFSDSNDIRRCADNPYPPTLSPRTSAVRTSQTERISRRYISPESFAPAGLHQTSDLSTFKRNIKLDRAPGTKCTSNWQIARTVSARHFPLRLFNELLSDELIDLAAQMHVLGAMSPRCRFADPRSTSPELRSALPVAYRAFLLETSNPPLPKAAFGRRRTLPLLLWWHCLTLRSAFSNLLNSMPHAHYGKSTALPYIAQVVVSAGWVAITAHVFWSEPGLE